ncbi:hypothetical protein D3C87_1596970 [compost metagenome]
MVVHRALRHTSGGGDLVHAGDLETVGTELGNRRLNDGFAFTVGEALWSCHKYASAGKKEITLSSLLVIGFDATLKLHCAV